LPPPWVADVFDDEDFDPFAADAPAVRPWTAAALFVGFFARLSPPLRFDDDEEEDDRPALEPTAPEEPELWAFGRRAPLAERVEPFFFAAIAISE